MLAIDLVNRSVSFMAFLFSTFSQRTKMTRAAKEYINKKIRVLIHEGYPQIQAVRIAYEMAHKEGFKIPLPNPAEVISFVARKEWNSFPVNKQVRILQFISGYVEQHGINRPKLIGALIHMFDVDESTADYAIEVYRKTVGHHRGRKGAPRTNPVMRDNPAVPSGAVEIYDHILAIEAVKGDGSLWPKEQFRHAFKPGSKASIYGMPDGSILIKSRNGKKLWKVFDYTEEDL